MTRRRLSATLAIIVTTAFLFLAARNVDIGQLWQTLGRARWQWLPVIVAVILLDLSIRALRWRVLLSVAKPGVRWWTLFRLETIGLSINNVLFMRLGELARAFLCARELGVPLATALASVAVERVLDVGALLSLFSLAACASPDLVPAGLRQAGLLVLGGALGGLALLVVAEAPLQPGGAIERWLRRWPRVHDLAVQLAAGAAVLRRPAAAVSAGALSLALWSVDALSYWAGARALGLGWAVDYEKAVLILAWAGAGAALPAAPGAFGTFEAMVKAILTKLGVVGSAALAFAVFNHLVQYLAVTALGLTFLYQVGLSLGELSSAVGGTDAAAEKP